MAERNMVNLTITMTREERKALYWPVVGVSF